MGETTVTCTATDHAGNVVRGAFNVAVRLSFVGLFAPIDNPPAVNVTKAGSAVPVKFSLGGDRGLAVFAGGYPASRLVTCDSSAPLDQVEETVAANASGLQYDPKTETYTYVWKTDRAWSGTCRRLELVLVDGSTHTAEFKMLK